MFTVQRIRVYVLYYIVVQYCAFLGYPLHLIDLLAKLYRKQLAKVKVAGTLSELFRVKRGVR